jgi:hypothetical protein
VYSRRFKRTERRNERTERRGSRKVAENKWDGERRGFKIKAIGAIEKNLSGSLTEHQAE